MKAYLKGKKFDILITFDDQGVSSHHNHISVSNACQQYFDDQKKKPKFKILLKLRTVGLFRKYSSFADIVNCAHNELHWFQFRPATQMRAMAAHHSQNVWFRKLFVWFSRYTFVNSFTF